MPSKGLKRTCTFLARWAILANIVLALEGFFPLYFLASCQGMATPSIMGFGIDRHLVQGDSRALSEITASLTAHECRGSTRDWDSGGYW
jgi:hypothetical protein